MERKGLENSNCPRIIVAIFFEVTLHRFTPTEYRGTIFFLLFRLIDPVSFTTMYILCVNRPFSNGKASKVYSVIVLGTKSPMKHNGKSNMEKQTRNESLDFCL